MVWMVFEVIVRRPGELGARVCPNCSFVDASSLDTSLGARFWKEFHFVASERQSFHVSLLACSVVTPRGGSRSLKPMG